MDETILLNYLQGECNDEEAARVETWCICRVKLISRFPMINMLHLS